MSAGLPRPTLSEARARLRELGYLQGRVERFVFRRALEGTARLLLPLLLSGALAAALAETAAVSASQFRYGESPGATALLFGHFFVAALVPAGALAGTAVDPQGINGVAAGL